MHSLTKSRGAVNIRINLPTVLLAVGVFAIFFVVMAQIQFSTPDMPDNDGYYHIKFAQIMREQGLKPEFPWLPMTILNSREFYDHHFLFHVALIPFTFGDLRLGAKWASVVFSSLALLSIWWLLYRQRIPYSGLWALGLLVVSNAFLYRMSITRAQALSLAVLVLSLHWLLQRKYSWLLPTAFVFVWMYDAFPLILIVAFLYSFAVLLVERRLELRPVVYVALGIGLGLLINPYFPNNIIFAYRHILPKLVEPTSVRVGNEWYPYTTGQLLENSVLAFVAFIAGALALGLKGERMDLRTAASFLIAIMFGWMLFQARRFVEYFPAFALIFAAFAWTPLIQSYTESLNNQKVKQYQNGSAHHAYPKWISSLRPWIPAAILVSFLVFGFWRTLPATQESMLSSKPYEMFAGSSAWLKTNTPEGELVFQTDWDDFPRLFFYNTQNLYLVGLDPTYLQLYDPDGYDQWVQITRGEVEDPSDLIYNRFASQYVVSDLNHQEFIERAEEDPDMQEVYRDENSVVFHIIK